MRIVLQRVARACVRVEGETVGQIGPGFAVMTGALVTLLVAVYIARLHDWSASKGAAQGQEALSVSRTSAGETSADDDRTGGPGQPGSSSGRSSE